MTKTFEQAWAEKERAGYQYGEDALEQVRFGWEIAQAELAEMKAEHEAMVALLRWAAIGDRAAFINIRGNFVATGDEEANGREAAKATDLATKLGLLPKPTAGSEGDHG